MTTNKKATPAAGGSSMPDNHVFPNGGVNECYGLLNGYRLLEAAEDSLAAMVEAGGIAACPASLHADLLILNQVEQIAENMTLVVFHIEPGNRSHMPAGRDQRAAARTDQRRAGAGQGLTPTQKKKPHGADRATFKNISTRDPIMPQETNTIPSPTPAADFITVFKSAGPKLTKIFDGDQVLGM